MPRFFEDAAFYSGPELSLTGVREAEEELGFKLPISYVDLLLEKNGGKPRNRCYPVSFRNSWAEDHIEIRAILGIGGKWGITSASSTGGSERLIEEWGYPNSGVVVCEMPSAGSDAVMLDYSQCGASGEPRVIHVDIDGSVHVLAPDFATFIGGLRSCGEFD